MTSPYTAVNEVRTTPERLRELVERLEQANWPDNRLDCEIDIALFAPDRKHASVRMNAAGTKLIYTRYDGRTDTYWSQDHTLTADRRATALEQLRAIASAESSS